MHMEYARDPLNPYTFPTDITPLGENGEAGYLLTFPDMPGCVAIGSDPGDAVGKGLEKAEKWLRITSRLEAILSLRMKNPDFRLDRFGHIFYCPDPDWGDAEK